MYYVLLEYTDVNWPYWCVHIFIFIWNWSVVGILHCTVWSVVYYSTAKCWCVQQFVMRQLRLLCFVDLFRLCEFLCACMYVVNIRIKC